MIVLSFFGIGSAPEAPKLEDRGERDMSTDDATGGGTNTTSKDEMRWLIDHVKLLKMNSYDNAKKRYSIISEIYKKLPRIMKILFLTAMTFAVLIIVPVAVWMLINIMQSKVAMMKMILLYIFLIVLTFAALLITI